MFPSYPFRYFPYQHKDNHPEALLTTTGSAYINHAGNFVPSEPFCPPSPVITINCKRYAGNVYQSTTKEAYKPFKNQPIACKYMNTPRYSTYSTNFKLPVDYKSNYFTSTNTKEYNHKCNDRLSAPAGKSVNLRQSVLGDEYKSVRHNIYHHLPCTEYDESYLKHCINNMGAYDSLYIAEKMNKDNVKRGIEAHNSSVFSTTAGDTYNNTYKQREKCTLSTIVLNEKAGVSSIPFGDRDKIKLQTSQHQDSYKIDMANQALLSKSSHYDKKKALDNVYQSSIRLGDAEHYKPNGSCAVSQYPNHGIQEKQVPVCYDRNKSSFPQGDLSPTRVKERMTYLSSSVYSKPPLGSFPSYNNVSHLRTRSSVHFGQDSSYTGQCCTTSVDTYKPVTICVNHAKRPTDSMMHAFRYKPEKPFNSTAQDSYDVKQLTNVSVNQSNLKESHWKLPYMGISFETTHQSHFAPPNKQLQQVR